MKRGYPHYGEEANLQADVMRFMAIVAFCLIAILAMVRQVPTLPTPPPVPLPDDPIPIEQLEKATAAIPTQPTPIPLPADIEAPLPTPNPTKAPKPKIRPTTPPERYRPADPPPLQQARVMEEPLQPEVAQKAAAPNTAEAASAESETGDQGLTLRFDSDGDFLRLIAKGKVAVYAFDESIFLSLGTNYRFSPTTPPSQFYELDKATVPSHLSQALPEDMSAAGLKWAVGLTPRVQRQIQQHLGRVEHGQLLINKYEEVRHVQAR